MGSQWQQVEVVTCVSHLSICSEEEHGESFM